MGNLLLQTFIINLWQAPAIKVDPHQCRAVKELQDDRTRRMAFEYV